MGAEFPAESSRLAPVRKTLPGRTGAGRPPQAVQSVLVAVGEACSNAIEHGHPDAARDFEA